MILGLDVSTSITGATVIDNRGNIVYCEAWDTRKLKNFFLKAQHIQKCLKDIKRQFPIKKIVIEQSLQMFRSGFSSAKTLLTLAKFNGIISYICQKCYLKPPEFISASTARKACGIKVERGKKAKEVVLNFLLDNDSTFSVEYTKHGNPKPGSYDRADSYIIAKAGWIKKNS